LFQEYDVRVKTTQGADKMKKFMTSFAAIAAAFSAQHAEAISASTIQGDVATTANAVGQTASTNISVTDKAGDAFAFTLKRSGDTGNLMAYHESHSSHASHSSHYSSR
jgi:hypothetical protein